MKRIPTLRLATIFIAILATILTIFVSLCSHVRHEQAQEQAKFDTQWADMVDSNSDSITHPEWYRMTTAGVTHMDSVAFEYLAERATAVDLPEATPLFGDTVCAVVVRDTIFIQHFNANKYDGYEYQRQMFRFVYEE